MSVLIIGVVNFWVLYSDMGESKREESKDWKCIGK